MAASDQVRKIVRAKLENKKRLPRPGRVLPPDNLEREYYRDLKKMIDHAKDLAEKHLLPKLQRTLASAERDRPEGFRVDAWPEDLEGAFQDLEDEFYRRYNPEEIRRLARKYGISVDAMNKRANEKNFRRVLGVDVFANEPWLEAEIRAFGARNVRLISSVPERLFNELEAGIFDQFSTGTRFEELAKFIEGRFEVAGSNALRIARDQVAKLNGQLTGLRQTNLGVTEYIWETSKDERVRDSHREKQGKKFKWNNPPSDTGHPGEDINCRCWASPVFESTVEGRAEFESGVDREEE